MITPAEIIFSVGSGLLLTNNMLRRPQYSRPMLPRRDETPVDIDWIFSSHQLMSQSLAAHTTIAWNEASSDLTRVVRRAGQRRTLRTFVGLSMPIAIIYYSGPLRRDCAIAEVKIRQEIDPVREPAVDNVP